VSKEIEDFIAGLRKGLDDRSFVKLTLSNYKGAEPHLQRVSARIVELKRGPRLMFQYRYDTREVVKNFEFSDAAAEAHRLLDSGFRSGHLFTAAGDLQLTVGKRNSRLSAGKPSFKFAVGPTHDRIKKTSIDPNAFYLKALGITADNGKIRAGQRDKWKQINKFVETLANLIENSSLQGKPDLRIVDMGSGKGYLTFALYDYLGPRTPSSASRVSVTGIELRPELVLLCNDIAKAVGFDGLNFVEGTIAETELGDVDILIALHACDTATDDAIYKAIAANAAIIVVAPCCHHEIKKQMKPPELLAGILKHPVMLERTAETITDGIRSMLLESKGYVTKMFEFVATEHTPKNNLLLATQQERTKNGVKSKQEIKAVLNEFGIEHQKLADLLNS
jgi:SAM-dependent methyltransferase